MKLSRCSKLVLVVCTAAAPFVSAFAQGEIPAGRGAPRAALEMETVAFLGVETAPVTATLTAQLGLPKGAGLVVRSVVPESPAASLLEPHDILLKFDDQLLIEPRQFSVLVRNRRQGDEVTLTYIRGGQQATGKVRLGQQQTPKLAAAASELGAAEEFDVLLRDYEAPPFDRGEMDRVLSLLEQKHVPAPGAQVPRGAPPPPAFRAVAIHPANSSMLFSDEQGSLELQVREGGKRLVAKNPKGESLYAGPVDTPEQRAALSPELRARLEKLESMQEFRFETDEHFRRDMKVVRPLREKISLPYPPAKRTPPPEPSI